MPPRATKSGYDGARMIYVIALLAGLLGAGAGAALGFGLGLALASMLNISSFEGAAGYFVVSIALIGALIGLPAGIVIALRLKGSRGFAATGGRTLAVLGIIGALVAAGICYRLATVEHFSGGNPTMEFEIRLPAGMAAPERNLCHASSVVALLEGIGSGAVSNPVMDIAKAEVRFVIGANPT